MRMCRCNIFSPMISYCSDVGGNVPRNIAMKIQEGKLLAKESVKEYMPSSVNVAYNLPINMVFFLIIPFPNPAAVLITVGSLKMTETFLLLL